MNSRNSVRIAAAPRDVFSVLIDAKAYAQWVVGARKVRSVDENWPAVGARFHHTVEPNIHDTTEILAIEPDRFVRLRVRFRPIGVALVELRLSAINCGHGTLIQLCEYPESGLVRSAPALTTRLLWLRNGLSLLRLRRLVERRSSGVSRSSDEGTRQGNRLR